MKKYIVSPYAYVKYGGKKMGTVSFDTLKGAKEFIKKRRLKRAILYKRK